VNSQHLHPGGEWIIRRNRGRHRVRSHVRCSVCGTRLRPATRYVEHRSRHSRAAATECLHVECAPAEQRARIAPIAGGAATLPIGDEAGGTFSQKGNERFRPDRDY
jgi:hypothetical protein